MSFTLILLFNSRLCSHLFSFLLPRVVFIFYTYYINVYKSISEFGVLISKIGYLSIYTLLMLYLSWFHNATKQIK